MASTKQMLLDHWSPAMKAARQHTTLWIRVLKNSREGEKNMMCV